MRFVLEVIANGETFRQVNNIEAEQAVLVKQRTFEITEKYRQLGHIPSEGEIGPNVAHECILKEITATLAHRKRLHAQVHHLQTELGHMERAATTTVTVAAAVIEHKPSTVPVATVKPHTVNCKPRKPRDREHRSRSQDWPDVPDVGKIEEQNPEILAQKILETGRQLEAARHTKPNVIVNGYVREDRDRPPRPAPPRPAPPQPPLAHRHSPVKPQKALNVVAKVQESPKVINFEDRLKSIITSVLNEDQEQRKAARPAPSPVAAAPPHGYANGYVRAAAFASRAPPPASSQFARARDSRRDRYPYERRDAHARPHVPTDPRHHHHHHSHQPHQPHQLQPDYTQVNHATLSLGPRAGNSI